MDNKILTEAKQVREVRSNVVANSCCNSENLGFRLIYLMLSVLGISFLFCSPV